MNKIVKWIMITAGALALVAFLAFINAYFIALLWNWLVPILLPEGPLVATITYWQAWGISVLCGLLFRSTCTSSCSKD